jgi:hypothetical protein
MHWPSLTEVKSIPLWARHTVDPHPPTHPAPTSCQRRVMVGGSRQAHLAQSAEAPDSNPGSESSNLSVGTSVERSRQPGKCRTQGSDPPPDDSHTRRHRVGQAPAHPTCPRARRPPRISGRLEPTLDDVTASAQRTGAMPSTTLPLVQLDPALTTHTDPIGYHLDTGWR